MKLTSLLLLATIIASNFLVVDARYVRGLHKDDNIVDDRGGDESKGATKKAGSVSTPTPTDETATTLQDASAGTTDEDEITIEVDVDLDIDDLSLEDQRRVSHAVIEALNALGMVALTEGEAPDEAVLTLDRYTLDGEIEEYDERRALGKYSGTRTIGTCRHCYSNRRARRNLKKSQSITKSLEGLLNTILKTESKEMGEKPLKRIKVKSVQYFEFEK